MRAILSVFLLLAGLWTPPTTILGGEAEADHWGAEIPPLNQVDGPSWGTLSASGAINAWVNQEKEDRSIFHGKESSGTLSVPSLKSQESRVPSSSWQIISSKREDLEIVTPRSGGEDKGVVEAGEADDSSIEVLTLNHLSGQKRPGPQSSDIPTGETVSLPQVTSDIIDQIVGGEVGEVKTESKKTPDPQAKMAGLKLKELDYIARGVASEDAPKDDGTGGDDSGANESNSEIPAHQESNEESGDNDKKDSSSMDNILPPNGESTELAEAQHGETEATMTGGGGDWVDFFVDTVRGDPEFEEISLEIENQCGAFDLEYYLSNTDGRSDGARFWGMDNTIVFVIVPKDGGEQPRPRGDFLTQRGTIACEPCEAAGGVSPDAYWKLRAFLGQKVGEVGAAWAEARLLEISERLAVLEVQLLERALGFEDERLEAGVGAGARVAILATRIAVATTDLSWIRREGRVAKQQFSESTGISLEKGGVEIAENLNLGLDNEVDFGAIFSFVVGASDNTDSAKKMMQQLAGGLVMRDEKAGERARTTVLASRALSKARAAYDFGKISLAEAEEASALLLRTQLSEVEALVGLAEARFRAHPPVKLEVLISPGLQRDGGWGASSIWLVGGVAVVAMLTFTLAGRRKRCGSKADSG